MTSIADSSVSIQTGSRVCPLNPLLAGGSRADSRAPAQAGGPYCHQ
jgi:hypothetical protein